MNSTRPVRTLRALAAASISTFVALFSHVAGGGVMPGFAGIAVPFALALLVCLPLSGQRRSVPRLVASVVVSQLLFHSLFVLGAGAGAGAGAAGALDHSMHGARHFVPMEFASVPTAVTSSMWISHVVAAVITIVALHSGERVLMAIAALRDRLRLALRAGAVAVLPVSRPRPLRVVLATLPLVAGRGHDHELAPLRGPPFAAV